MGNFASIQAAWRSFEKERPNQDFLKIPSLDSERYTSYKVGTFYKRISRLCSAFRSALRIKPGETVAIMTEQPQDMALLFHSIWLGCYTALPVDMTLSDERIVELFKLTKVSVAVFPLEMAARVASLISRCPGVKHWLVCGTSSFLPSNSGMKKLDELMASTAGFADEFDDKGAANFPALITFTKGSSAQPAGVMFTQAQLVAAAESASRIYPKDPIGESAWSLILPRNLNGIVQAFLAPLFTGIPVVLNFNYELKDFWDLVQANAVTFALMTQTEMRYINRRGKTRNWTAPAKFGVGLFSNEVISAELIANFEKRFAFGVNSCYSQTEAGGVVSAFPSGESAEYNRKYLYDYDVPSSGIIVPGMELQIQDKFGEALAVDEVGEIVIKSSQCMKAYYATSPGTAYFGSDGWLHTGDEGFIKLDEQGRQHLFVTGRFEEFIMRGMERVNLGLLDTMLLEIKGVDFARAVGFPNSHTGVEIGAFVQPLRASNVSKKEIMAALREKLPWSECPKVLIVAENGKVERKPKRQELVALFDQYNSEEFVEGAEEL